MQLQLNKATVTSIILIFLAGIAVGWVLSAKIQWQPALPLGLEGKTIQIQVHNPKCPSDEQKNIINRERAAYFTAKNQGGDPTIAANKLIAMAKTLGYPVGIANTAKTDEQVFKSILAFLYDASVMRCVKGE